MVISVFNTVKIPIKVTESYEVSQESFFLFLVKKEKKGGTRNREI